MGIARILESQFSEDSEQAEITRDELAILVRNARRLERLPSDILEITRIESGKLTLHVQEFNLNDIIMPLVQDFNNKNRTKEGTEGRKIIIHYNNAPDDVIVNGDKDRIAEVIWNLLDNATKFTDKGRITVTAGIPEEDNQAAMVTVKDEGSGIDPEVMPKLFTKFTTK